GGITALAVSLLVLPTRAHSLAIEAAAQMLEVAARSLSELFAGFLQARDGATIGSIQDSIGPAFARLDAIAAEARHERITFLAAEPDPRPLLRLRLRHDLVMIGRAAAMPLARPGTRTRKRLMMIYRYNNKLAPVKSTRISNLAN